MFGMKGISPLPWGETREKGGEIPFCQGEMAETGGEMAEIGEKFPDVFILRCKA